MNKPEQFLDVALAVFLVAAIALIAIVLWVSR